LTCGGALPAAGVFRRAERDFELAGRYSVRASCRLLCVLRATARLDPRWEGHRQPGDPLHPEAFCPDRWACARWAGRITQAGLHARGWLGRRLAALASRLEAACMLRRWMHAWGEERAAAALAVQHWAG
jgi:hypothetical protein